MSPQKRVREEYAEDFLNHKATVEVSYSVSHVENSALVSVLRDPAGPFFVNYVLVPEKLSWIPAATGTSPTSRPRSG